MKSQFDKHYKNKAHNIYSNIQKIEKYTVISYLIKHEHKH